MSVPVLLLVVCPDLPPPFRWRKGASTSKKAQTSLGPSSVSPILLLPRICRSAPLQLVSTALRSVRALGPSAFTCFSVPIIQNENRVASIAITATTFTVVSSSITRESSSQTLRGSPHIIPTSAIDSSGVAASDTSSPNDTSIAQYSSTAMCLPAATIFAIVLGGVALLAAMLCFALRLWRRSPPAPPSVNKARYLRKRRRPRSVSEAWTTIEPVVSPYNVDALTATLPPPRGDSIPAAPNPPSQLRLSGFRIPRKAPPRLPSWALPTLPNIPEIRSPEPFRLIPDPVLVRQIPSTLHQYPLASANLISLSVRETRPTPHQVVSSQVPLPSPD